VSNHVRASLGQFYRIGLALMLLASHGLALPREAKSLKGIELYGWRVQSQWVFVLLPGTNRLKTETEIRAAAQHLGFVALTKRLAQLALHEDVFWHSFQKHQAPDDLTKKQLLEAAQAAQVRLHL
jgi:hypothetical protein